MSTLSEDRKSAEQKGKERAKRTRKTSSEEQNTQNKDDDGIHEINSLFAEKKSRKADKTFGESAKRKHNANTQGATKQKYRRTSAPKKASTGWVDDGLGGKYNPEGFTGRVQEGIKIYKAHVLNKRQFGSSKDCPFDCDCCFI